MTDVLSANRSERDRLAKDAEDLHFIEFWKKRAEIEITQPRKGAVPILWRWSDIEPRLRTAAKIVPIEECERRSLTFVNPGLAPKPYVTGTMIAACSLYNPGEKAPVHRHTPSALRFVLDGDGGFTVVEGEKLSMRRGDLVLTPGGAWHDHGNDGTQAVIWVDILDVPLMESLNVTAFEFEYKEVPNGGSKPVAVPYQTISKGPEYSQRRYSAGGLLPLFDITADRGHSPMYIYRWDVTRAALEGMRDQQGCPTDGIIFEYVDPTTGRPVIPTLSARAQLLRPDEHTTAVRKSASTVYCVLEGEGYTIVEGQRLDWRRNDIFVVPGWQWHEHVNSSGGDAFLFSATDEPTMVKLGVMRKEQRGAE